MGMKQDHRALAAAGALLLALPAADAASAQKAGDTLKISHFGSAASKSILEEFDGRCPWREAQ
jgi:spermidine/putrescine-binding protein